MNEKEKAIILIDYENLKENHIEKLEFVFNHPELPKNFVVNQAYAYFKDQDVRRARQFQKYSIDPMQTMPFNSSGKNGADIRMIVDAMELIYSDGIDHFVFVSGDSDFIHLYKKLKRKNKKVTVFAEMQSLGQYIGRYCHVILIPKFHSPKIKKQHISNIKIKKIPKKGQEILILNVIKSLSLFQKVTLSSFIWALNFSYKGFHINKLGHKNFNELITNSKHLFKFNTITKEITLNTEVTIQIGQLEKAIYPLLIHKALYAHSRELEFIPFGLHKVVFLNVIRSVESIKKGEKVNIYNFKGQSLELKESKEIKVGYIERCITLLCYANIIEYSKDNTCFMKKDEKNTNEMLKVLHQYIRKVCYTSKSQLKENQWQRIIDKTFQ